MKQPALILIGILWTATALGGLPIAEDGTAHVVILQQPGATEPEKLAVTELASHLHKVTGAEFEVRSPGEFPDAAIIVGPGPLAARLFPEIHLDDFGPEELICIRKGNYLLLAGGRPRGTLYAVNRFLEEECGVRWWAPWATHVPERRHLEIGDLNRREQPAFEYREPFWYPAFEGRWAVRNYYNGHRAQITPDMGGKITYLGFVHTFYSLVPPDRHFERHPEWYSLIGGKRTVDRGQLCLTNPELQKFVVERVRQRLRESPGAAIVSVSQNDWYGNCECGPCREVDEAEGSAAGSLLLFVNGVAEAIGPEFPDVAVDTLAYQYTRKPPRTVQPLPNVIVRLCSIECNFAVPLDHPDNAAFANDIEGWAEICDRLYIWDYTTDFSHYVQPHPNWFVLGPNVRFFHRNKVRGLFEQGAYQSHGAEMAELRAWVLARLLWDPYQDDKKLTGEFLEGYYGAGPAGFIYNYFELMEAAVDGFYVTCFSPSSAPFLNFQTLARAEQLWQEAVNAAQDEEQLWRVRQGHLAVRYVFLARWSQLRREWAQSGGEWPLPESRKAVADQWLAAATGPGPDGWSAMTHVNEWGLTPQKFISRFEKDPPVIRPEQLAIPEPPADLAGREWKECVDLQDSLATLYREGSLADFRADPAASDGWAVWMPGSHHEWALQFPGSTFPKRALKGSWDVYAVVRVETGESGEGALFRAGVYDTAEPRLGIGVTVSWEGAGEGYRSYHLGRTALSPEQYIWVAPAANAAVSGIWVDRIYLVPATE